MHTAGRKERHGIWRTWSGWVLAVLTVATVLAAIVLSGLEGAGPATAEEPGLPAETSDEFFAAANRIASPETGRPLGGIPLSPAPVGRDAPGSCRDRAASGTPTI